MDHSELLNEGKIIARINIDNITANYVQSVNEGLYFGDVIQNSTIDNKGTILLDINMKQISGKANASSHGIEINSDTINSNILNSGNIEIKVNVNQASEFYGREYGFQFGGNFTESTLKNSGSILTDVSLSNIAYNEGTLIYGIAYDQGYAVSNSTIENTGDIIHKIKTENFHNGSLYAYGLLWSDNYGSISDSDILSQGTIRIDLSAKDTDLFELYMSAIDVTNLENVNIINSGKISISSSLNGSNIDSFSIRGVSLYNGTDVALNNIGDIIVNIQSFNSTIKKRYSPN
jgi:hypothetical protein